MNVTFTRIGERRYRVSIEGPGLEPLYMDPAPGYDTRLPHDAAHFIVENELAILGGVFGQLAAGGTANTFRSENLKKPRKKKKQGEAMAKANREDALFSEHAVYAAQSRWEKHDIIPDTKIPAADIVRIIEKYEEFGRKWSKLPVGGSVTLEWRHVGKASPPTGKRRDSLSDIRSDAFEIIHSYGLYFINPMTPRCVAKLRPIKQRANLFAGD